jgi:hypothetical protein
MNHSTECKAFPLPHKGKTHVPKTNYGPTTSSMVFSVEQVVVVGWFITHIMSHFTYTTSKPSYKWGNPFFYWWNFSPKKFQKIQKVSDFGGFQSPKVRK